MIMLGASLAFVVAKFDRPVSARAASGADGQYALVPVSFKSPNNPDISTVVRLNSQSGETYIMIPDITVKNGLYHGDWVKVSSVPIY